jgi:hypothetical protein
MNKRLTSFLGLCAACLIVAASVAGCASVQDALKDAPIGYPLEANASYPLWESAQRFYAGRPESEQALILVGSFGDEVLAELSQTSLWQHEERWIIHLTQRRYNDVYLLPVKVDKEKPFKFDFAVVAPNPNRKSGDMREMRLKIRGTQGILIDKPGIYYFGTIISNDQKGIVVSEVDPRVVNLAMKKYPKIFEKMPRINF